ncbi:hypothetical protein QYM36_012707, partial [Artemia franciscana]
VLFCQNEEELPILRDDSVLFVLDEFQTPIFEDLTRDGKRKRIIGYPLFEAFYASEKPLPEFTRPVFCLSMHNVCICVSGFRKKEDVIALCKFVHWMGGKIRNDFSKTVTHLISSISGTDKCNLALTLGVPVMTSDWIQAVWKQRHKTDCHATNPEFMTYKMKIFHNLKMHFYGFPDNETDEMMEVLVSNGGKGVDVNDPNLTHVVVAKNSKVPQSLPSNVKKVKMEWFWASIQMEYCADPKTFVYEEEMDKELVQSPQTPVGILGKNRKRLFRETSPVLASPSKRRSSVSESCEHVPDGIVDDGLGQGKTGLFAVQLKDMTQREKVFMELLQTEVNYVGILSAIDKVFRMPLEAEDQPGGPLLAATEIKIIFGNIPAIVEVHGKILEDFTIMARNWKDNSIGRIFLKHRDDILRAYQPYINFFENSKATLQECYRRNPRFHAFLKIGQGKPECGRQSLEELMIRPIQRLPSITLLLNDLLKRTGKSNPDHALLEEALAAIKKVNSYLNEDKRKTDGQVALFEVVNFIENCPANIISSNRNFLNKVEVIALNTSSVFRGDLAMLVLFSDILEVCKKRNKFASGASTSTLPLPARTPSRVGTPSKTPNKLYKHAELIPLHHIKRIVDINETEECPNAFAFIVRSPKDLREKRCAWRIISEDVNKLKYIRTLAETICVLTQNNTENLLTSCDAGTLEIDTSDLSNRGFSRAVKFASRTSDAVSRTLKGTPTMLKRTVSSILRPMHSTASLGSTSVFSDSSMSLSVSETSNLTGKHCESSMSLDTTVVLNDSRCIPEPSKKK